MKIELRKSLIKILRLTLVTLLIVSVVPETGCKSSKAAAAAKAKAAADAQAKADAEAKRKADAEAAAAAAAARNAANKPEPSAVLASNLQQIATAQNVSQANQVIATALQNCSSPDVPVLIIIYRDATTVDYDQPTTISKYLNYVKDQKSNPTTIDHVDLDSNGKISQVVLIKK